MIARKQGSLEAKLLSVTLSIWPIRSPADLALSEHDNTRQQDLLRLASVYFAKKLWIKILNRIYLFDFNNENAIPGGPEIFFRLWNRSPIEGRSVREFDIWVLFLFAIIVSWSLFGLTEFSHSYVMFMPLAESLKYDSVGNILIGGMLVAVSCAYAIAGSVRIAAVAGSVVVRTARLRDTEVPNAREGAADHGRDSASRRLSRSRQSSGIGPGRWSTRSPSHR
jgi:hypothetical protein